MVACNVEIFSVLHVDVRFAPSGIVGIPMTCRNFGCYKFSSSIGVLSSIERLLNFRSTGTVEVLEYPSLQTLQTLVAHTAGCYCIAIDPTGRLLLVLLPESSYV